jgi:hypothetical protein
VDISCRSDVFEAHGKFAKFSVRKQHTDLKGTVARDFTTLVCSSKVSILGPDSYPKFFSNLVSNSLTCSGESNFKFENSTNLKANSKKT